MHKWPHLRSGPTQNPCTAPGRRLRSPTPSRKFARSQAERLDRLRLALDPSLTGNCMRAQRLRRLHALCNTPLGVSRTQCKAKAPSCQWIAGPSGDGQDKETYGSCLATSIGKMLVMFGEQRGAIRAHNKECAKLGPKACAPSSPVVELNQARNRLVVAGDFAVAAKLPGRLRGVLSR